MSRWVAVLPLLLAASPVARADATPVQKRLRPSLVPDLALARSWQPLDAKGSASTTPPPCIADVCQPRVALPGREPKFSTQGKRTELVVRLLERSKMEPLATITWYLAATGLRLDLMPSQQSSSPAGGRTQAMLVLRWRLDANNRPVWPSRAAGRI